MTASDVLNLLVRYVGHERFMAAYYKLAYWWTLRTGITAFDYGYAPYSELVAGDQKAQEPYQMELYNQAALFLDRKLHGTRVLEISCGLGGGFDFIVRHYGVGFGIVLDYTLGAVTHARTRFGLAGVQGDGRVLPFADRSFDTVINIEASHNYFGDDFLAELARILAPGGQVVIADWRWGTIVDIETALRADFARFGLRIVRFREITQNVIAACEADTPRREAFLTKLPWPIRDLARQWIGTTGAGDYRSFVTHRAGYFLLGAVPQCFRSSSAIGREELAITHLMRMGPGTARRDAGWVVEACGKPGHVIFGPCIELAAGPYALRVRVEGYGFQEDSRARLNLDVYDGDRIIALRTIYRTQVGFAELEIEFEVSPKIGRRHYEFRLWSPGTISCRVTRLALFRCEPECRDEV